MALYYGTRSFSSTPVKMQVIPDISVIPLTSSTRMIDFNQQLPGQMIWVFHHFTSSCTKSDGVRNWRGRNEGLLILIVL
jgi:hypothetical protein